MRLSNGTSITYGSDPLGYAILIDGDPRWNVLSHSSDWTLDEQAGSLTDSRRCWRIPSGKIMERTTNQCPPDFLFFLQGELDKLSPEGLHPSLVNGFHTEAERLFPKISAEAKSQFKSFVSFLKTTYQIDEEEERTKPMTHVVDDMGPSLLVVIDHQPGILPEIPPVYIAPTDWALAIWRINNHMVGPLLMEDLEDQDKIQFLGLSIPTAQLSDRQKGIYYFHMARFILFFEAWVGNPDAPYLLEFIRLFRSGIRFLDKTFTS